MDSKLLDKTEVKAPDEMLSKFLEKLDKGPLSDSEDEFPDIECGTCSKTFPSVQMFEQHLNSRKHYKMLSKMKAMQKLGPDAMKRKSDEDPMDLNSDSNEELYCDVCDKEMSGYMNYMAHMKGGVHAKNLKQLKLKEKVKGMKESIEGDFLDGEEDDTLQKPFARCSPCGKTFYGPESYQQHLKGANHKKKLRHLKLIESLKTDEDTEKGTEDGEIFTKCEVCSKSFSGPVPYRMHLKSSVHGKELQRVKAEEELKDYFEKDDDGAKLICKECKKVFSDPISFKSHLANNSHGKQKVKDVIFGFVASNPGIVAVKSVQNVSSDEETEEKENFQNGRYFLVCKLCHMSFSGPESARDHLESKKHLKAKKEKTEKKMLIQKLKDKQNGHPLEDQKASEVPGNTQKDPSTNGEKTGMAPNPKHTDESNIQEDFEFI